MSAVAKTIWMIESRLGAPVPLDELARHAGVSRSHLSRLFPLITGYSLSAYMRGRRLTEAAKTLAAGAPDILTLALESGYGSHEAFTRAFRDQFGTTPEDVRRQRSTHGLNLMEPLDMDNHVSVSLADPVIETRPAMRIAGLMEWLQMEEQNSFSALWQRFGPYMGHISAVDRAAYGVVAEANESACQYMAGMEVPATADLPPELKTLTIPAGRYARFRHEGHISTIRSTIQAVYAEGLPRAGLTQAEGVSFVEYYGPDFEPQTGLGTVEIWIGVTG